MRSRLSCGSAAGRTSIISARSSSGATARARPRPRRHLFGEYDIKGSFYVPGVVAETYPGLLPYLVERGHEFAHRGYFHERIEAIAASQAERVPVPGAGSSFASRRASPA